MSHKRSHGKKTAVNVKISEPKLKGLKIRRVEKAREAEESIRKEAALLGIALEVQDTQCLHWMFNFKNTDARILSYWPSTGSCIEGEFGKKHSVGDAQEALDLAKRLSDLY